MARKINRMSFGNGLKPMYKYVSTGISFFGFPSNNLASFFKLFSNFPVASFLPFELAKNIIMSPITNPIPDTIPIMIGFTPPAVKVTRMATMEKDVMEENPARKETAKMNRYTLRMPIILTIC